MSKTNHSDVDVSFDPGIKDGIYYCYVISNKMIIDKIPYARNPQNKEYHKKMFNRIYKKHKKIYLKIIFKF